MTFTRVSPPDAPPPKGYTPAVSVIAGRLVFLSGQTALDPSGTIRGETVVEQFDRALGNLVQALTAAGGTPDQLVKVTVFCVDPADYRRHSAELGRVWRERAGRDYPAMTLVGVTRLWDEEALVELEGVAALP
jgi:enamine deaminase RidA (YjgF/YER057c/UK114 family)